LDKKDDAKENLVDDANEDNDNADAAIQTDDNSADVVLEIINIDINNDTGRSDQQTVALMATKVGMPRAPRATPKQDTTS
jgi:hypothetical protein